MNTVNATFAKQNFGTCLMNVSGGPILIEKSGTPAAVIMSYDEYNRLINIEDTMLLKIAIEAASRGFLNEDESKNLFDEMNEKFFNSDNEK